MSTQDSTTNSTSGTSQAAEQNASFQQKPKKKKESLFSPWFCNLIEGLLIVVVCGAFNYYAHLIVVYWYSFVSVQI